MQGTIKRIEIFRSGKCYNYYNHIFKKHNLPTNKICFHANVVYIKHEIYGGILVDTGYSELVYTNGFVSKIYNLANPTEIEEKDIAINKLKNRGINEDEF